MTQTARAAHFLHDRRFEITNRDVPMPGPGEVALRVAYCGICGTDLHIYHGAMADRLGDRRVLGHEVSGRIEALGAGVNGLAPGQKAVVRPLAPCGDCPACAAGHAHVCHRLKFLGIDTDGGFSDIWTVPSHAIHILPEDVPLKTAALVEPLAVACHAVARGRIAAGEDVLVVGGGPIGMLVALAARDSGARVLLSEVNPARLALAARMGFDTVNPAKVDLPARIATATGGKGADAVFEVSGAQRGLEATTQAAAVRGRIVMVAIYPEQPKIDMFRYFWRELELIGARVYEPQDYDRAIAMIGAGAVDAAALITDVVPLEQIQPAFETLSDAPSAMKTLVEITGG